MPTLKLETSMETVTYGQEGCPEVSGYGSDIECLIKKERVVLITIGNNTFMLEQIEELVTKAKAFDTASIAFDKAMEIVNV